MAKKLELIDRSLVITDTGTGIIEAEFPAKDVYFDNDELVTNAVLKLYDTNGVNEKSAGVFREDLANCVDSNLATFTASTLRDFARVSLGFSTPAGGTAWSKTLSPPAWTGHVDDYAPAGWDSSIAFLRVDSGSNSRTMSGLDSTGFKNGQSVFIANVSSQRRITLSNNDSASLPQNRFISKGDTTLEKEEGILAVYDGVTQRWRLDKAD